MEALIKLDAQSKYAIVLQPVNAGETTEKNKQDSQSEILSQVKSSWNEVGGLRVHCMRAMGRYTAR